MKYFFVAIISSFLILSCEEVSTEMETSKAPTIQVIDTDFSKGQLNHVQEINLNDLVKLHGHLCDGLVVGYLGLNEAFKKLYPNGIVDRTNTRIISKSSPCLTDAAIYLTGGRYQYNSFYVNDSIEGFYQIQRLDNQKSIFVNLKKAVKPTKIDSLGNLAIQQKLTVKEINHLRKLEDEFTVFLLNTPPNELFQVEIISDFQWKPNTRNDYLKTDVLNKHLSE